MHMTYVHPTPRSILEDAHLLAIETRLLARREKACPFCGAIRPVCRHITAAQRLSPKAIRKAMDSLPVSAARKDTGE